MQAVDSKKIVKYDVDGYDIVTNALKDLLNQYPGLETGEVLDEMYRWILWGEHDDGKMAERLFGIKRNKHGNTTEKE